MALKDIVIAQRTIKFKEGAFTVEGLSFEHLTRILLDNESDVRKAFALFEKHAGQNADRGPSGMQAFGMALATNLPDLVAALIAQAAGEPEMTSTVKKLPGPTQLEALIAVAELTFEDADAVKKFLENLYVAIKGTTETLEAIKPMAATLGLGTGSTSPAERK